MSPELLIESQRSRNPGVIAAAGRFGSRLQSFINTSPVAAFAGLSIFYATVFIILSSVKLLWIDELITLHIARLANVFAIWKALAMGADPNPPITHILVHACYRIFGDHEWALRLPAAVGYWIGLISLFIYLRRRFSATWALSGTVLSMAMAAFDYSYESRSYGIFYGLAMLALLGWSDAVDAAATPARRRLGSLAMVLGLAAGVSTNYFAVLAFLPIIAGEIARSLRNSFAYKARQSFGISALRAIDLRVWFGVVLASLPLLAFRGMIARSIAQFAPYAWNKVSLEQVTNAYTQMVEVILYPILALIAVAVLVWLATRFVPSFRPGMSPRWIGALAGRAHQLRPILPLHESVAVVFFMAYPFLGYAMAIIHGGMLSPRFVIPVCFGFAIAGTVAAFHLFGNRAQAGIVLLCFYLCWFSAREAVVGYRYEEQKQCFYNVLGDIPKAEIAGDRDAPIVIPDPLMVLTFEHYAPPAMSTRVVFPVDFPAIRSYQGDDSPERNLWAGRNFLYTVPILPLATFLQRAGKYILLASDGNWLVIDLIHHGYPVRRLPINTRAGAIGGFTPLSHGTPAFFVSSGDEAFAEESVTVSSPRKFYEADNLPESNTLPVNKARASRMQTQDAASQAPGDAKIIACGRTSVCK